MGGWPAARSIWRNCSVAASGRMTAMNRYFYSDSLPTRNRDPQFEPAQAGAAVELLAIAFERRAVQRTIPGVSSRVVPDGAPRGSDRRHVVFVFEDRVRLRRNAEPREFRGLLRELAHADTSDVLVGACVVRVADDAVGLLAHLIPDCSEIGHEAIPLRRDAGVRAVALSEPEDQECVFAHHARRCDRRRVLVVDSDWTHELDSFDAAAFAERFRHHVGYAVSAYSTVVPT